MPWQAPEVFGGGIADGGIEKEDVDAFVVAGNGEMIEFSTST